MFTKNPKSGVIEVPAGTLQEIEAAERPHREQNLKLLLIQYGYLTFRAYVVFPKKHASRSRNPTRTFYSHETRSTYRQCLHGRVNRIELNKLEGYQNLIKLIDEDMKGQWLSAKIYGRNPDTGEFDKLHREYYQGGLKDANDPVLTESDIQHVYFRVENHRLVLTDEPVPTNENFKQLINQQLNAQS